MKCNIGIISRSMCWGELRPGVVLLNLLEGDVGEV